MPPKIARLAGLGAFGAVAGLLALYLFVVFITRPTAASGLTAALAAVVWIALGVVFAGLIVLHIAIGRQLLELGRGENDAPTVA